MLGEGPSLPLAMEATNGSDSFTNDSRGRAELQVYLALLAAQLAEIGQEGYPCPLDSEGDDMAIAGVGETEQDDMEL
jgi:hypothetical protein